MGELDVYGVYVPMLLIQAIAAYVLLRIFMIGIDKWVEQGWIAMPNMFYLCLYIMLLGVLHWLYIIL